MATATTTYSHAPSHAPVTASGEARKSWLSRFFGRMVEAQMLVARKRVNEQLRGMSDETLVRTGFTPHQIKILRAGGEVDFPG